MAADKVYKRILLKLSGEALTGQEAYGGSVRTSTTRADWQHQLPVRTGSPRRRGSPAVGTDSAAVASIRYDSRALFTDRRECG